MAPPHRDANTSFPMQTRNFTKPPNLSNDNLKRTISDISYELSNGIEIQKDESNTLPPISEVEEAKCECCGMTEEYTQEYVQKVRDKFLGKWICGLCSEAVKEEMERKEGNCKEALKTHMSHCVRFNKLGRAYPVLCQAEAMREILKKGSRVRAKSMSPRDHKKIGIARSSSCMPAMMDKLALED